MAIEGARDGKRTFSLAEARALLPEVQRLTAAAHAEVEALRARAEAEPARREALQAQANGVVVGWTRGLQALGVEVKGLWLADFDNGAGYYCWRYPEAGLEYYHSYEEGFRGRIRIH